MSNQAEEEELRLLAKMLTESLTLIYGHKKAFFLCIGDFEGAGTIADYIGNAERETAVSWMRDTIDRFETGRTIPAPSGRIQ